MSKHHSISHEHLSLLQGHVSQSASSELILGQSPTHPTSSYPPSSSSFPFPPPSSAVCCSVGGGGGTRKNQISFLSYVFMTDGPVKVREVLANFGPSPINFNKHRPLGSHLFISDGRWMLLAKVLLITVTVYNFSMGHRVSTYNLESVRDTLDRQTANCVAKLIRCGTKLWQREVWSS